MANSKPDFLSIILSSLYKEKGPDRAISISQRQQVKNLRDEFLKLPLDYSMAENGVALFKDDWNKFMEAMASKGLSFNGITIIDILENTPITPEREKNAPYGHTIYKLTYEELLKGPKTKGLMRPVRETRLDAIGFDTIGRFFQEYSSLEEIEIFFKDWDLKEADKEWMVHFLAKASKNEGNAFIEYIFKHKIVEARVFFDEAEYQTRFNELKPQEVKLILSQLPLKGKKDRALVKSYLQHSTLLANVNRVTFELVVEHCRGQGIEWHLEEIVKNFKSFRFNNKVDEAFTFLYNLIKPEDARQLLFLVINDFLPGKNTTGLVDKLRAKMEKLELEKMFKPNQLEDFIIEKGLGAEFENFLKDKQKAASEETNKQTGQNKKNKI